jgi:hypothetical protein
MSLKTALRPPQSAAQQAADLFPTLTRDQTDQVIALVLAALCELARPETTTQGCSILSSLHAARRDADLVR